MGLRTKLGLKNLARYWDFRRAAVRHTQEPVVAGMATMPSRQSTFVDAFASIIRQVDKLYLYLDGHMTVPSAVRGEPRVVPILANQAPGLHANGKLLGLVLEEQPCLYVCVDDDLYFRRDFVSKLRAGLAYHADRAVVGLHGSILARPFERYNLNRLIFSYSEPLDRTREVDVLGTGAVMFASPHLRFDVRAWPAGNMTDLGLAIEAARAGLPLISLARRRKEVIPLAENQADSLQVARRRDDAFQTALCRQLLAIRGGSIETCSRTDQ